MKLTIQTFAVLKEHFHQKFEFESSAIETIEQLRTELSKMKPVAASILRSCRFALNDELVNDTTELYDNAAIYIIPPSSGG